MATTEIIPELHKSPEVGDPLNVGQTHRGHQSHFHYPTATFHNLGQKMKKTALWHKKPQNEEQSPFCPETDIRETNLAYHIEVSIAGVKDKESLVIQWMSSRTLLVQGKINRPDIGHSKSAEGDRQWGGDTDGWAAEAKNPPKNEVERDGGELHHALSNDVETQIRDTLLFLINERKTGSFQRTFTLPMDVNMKELKVKLEDGLLRIDLPKRDISGNPRVKIEAEY